MANSTIKTVVNPITAFSNDYVEGVLLESKGIAILFCDINSGENGMSQYFQCLYESIPSAYRPQNTKSTIARATNGNIYGFQILPTGSLQTTVAIPSNCKITLMAAWKY